MSRSKRKNIVTVIAIMAVIALLATMGSLWDKSVLTSEAAAKGILAGFSVELADSHDKLALQARSVMRNHLGAKGGQLLKIHVEQKGDFLGGSSWIVIENNSRIVGRVAIAERDPVLVKFKLCQWALEYRSHTADRPPIFWG